MISFILYLIFAAVFVYSVGHFLSRKMDKDIMVRFRILVIAFITFATIVNVVLHCMVL